MSSGEEWLPLEKISRRPLNVDSHQLLGVNYLAPVDLTDVAEGLFQRAVLRDMCPHVDKDQFATAFSVSGGGSFGAGGCHALNT